MFRATPGFTTSDIIFIKILNAIEWLLHSTRITLKSHIPLECIARFRKPTKWFEHRRLLFCWRTRSTVSTYCTEKDLPCIFPHFNGKSSFYRGYVSHAAKNEGQKKGPFFNHEWQRKEAWVRGYSFPSNFGWFLTLNPLDDEIQRN